MADLAQVQKNVARMVADDLPDETIDAYIAAQGTTLEEVRDFGRSKVDPSNRNVPEFDPGIENYNPVSGLVERPKKSKTTSFIEGAGNNITLGFGDEIAALPISMLKGQTYDDTLNQINVQQREAKADNPKTYLGGQVAGSVAQGVALAPLSATARAYQAGVAMPKIMAASGLDAAVLGGLSGVGEGTTLEDRAKKGAKGAVIGGATGLVSPLATSLLGTAWQGLKGAAGAGNVDRAKRLIAETLNRSGKPAKDVVDEVTQAATEGQPMYTMADALGYSGQRRLSGVTRVPGPQSQKVIDALDTRQAGQGKRIATFLDEGFNTQGGTALKKAAADKATRQFEGNLNYGAARDAAGAVDTSAAIQKLDDILTPGVTKLIGSGTDASPGVFNTIAKARSFLTDGKAQATDFDAVLAARVEIGDMIEKAGGVTAVKLKPIRDALDDALGQASQPYANAVKTYRLQSEGIEAVEKGRGAAMRGRTEDTTSLFGGMGPHEQPGFRAGYVDPLIEQVQGAAVGVNKARPLINDATAVEFPAFAAPGKAPQLQRQIDRENTMFKTANAAAGGSATAQNLADSTDTSNVGMLVNLLTNPKAAAIQGVAQLAAGAQGMNETTRELVADMLMKTDPQEVQKVLEMAMGSGEKALKARALLNMMFNQAGPRAAAPFVEPMLPQ